LSAPSTPTLDWRRIERDATPRSVDSYWRILWKLAEDYPEIEVSKITTEDLRRFVKRWADKSASTRSNVISVIHSFFDWALVEDHIDVDPSAKIRRPKKRRPDIYRPSVDELRRIRDAARGHERPAIVLMEGAGLRRAEVLGLRWADFDMVKGRVRVLRKGQHWAYLPLAPDVIRELRASMRELQPELDDYGSRSRSSSSSRNTSASVGARIRRCLRVSRRSGGWCSASASARAFVSSRLISFGTASQIASSGSPAAT
jgi:integrase/recombinase XerC